MTVVGALVGADWRCGRYARRRAGRCRPGREASGTVVDKRARTRAAGTGCAGRAGAVPDGHHRADDGRSGASMRAAFRCGSDSWPRPLPNLRGKPSPDGSWAGDPRWSLASRHDGRTVPCESSGGRLDSAAALAPKRPLTRSRAVRPADLRRAGVRSQGGCVRLHARLRARASRNLRFKSSCPSSVPARAPEMSDSSEPSCGEGSDVMVTSGFRQWEAQACHGPWCPRSGPRSGRGSAKVGEASTPAAAGHNGSRSPTNTTRRTSSSPHDRRQRSHWLSGVLRTGGNKRRDASGADRHQANDGCG